MGKAVRSATLLLLCATLARAVNWYAVGLNDQQNWSSFTIQAIDIYHGAYLHHSEFTPSMEIQMSRDWYGNRPNDEPFVFYCEFSLSADAVIIGAKVRLDNTWHTAQPQDVWTAENQFQTAPAGQPRCLLRQYVQRDYSGARSKRYLMQVSPIQFGSPFSIAITFLAPNTLELDSERASIFNTDFLTYRERVPIRYSFLDVHAPENAPVFENAGGTIPFAKNAEGWWRADLTYLYWIDPYVSWPARKNIKPELFYYQDNVEGYYLLSAFPPVEPQERKPKKVLILADLGSQTMGYTREFLLDQFHDITDRSLSWNDSLNILLMDQLEPKLLRSRFVPADYANQTALFNEMRSYPIPQLSATTQLLRRAVAFFNQAATDGEIWLITTAEKDAVPVQKANDIIELTVRQLRQQVVIKIVACGQPSDYLYVGGQYYAGNDYLFENLTRLTHGGTLRPGHAEAYHLPLALAELLAPALDLMEADPVPANGYNRNKYYFFSSRTRYPLLYPYIELGRAEGGPPFITDFYGNVEGDWFHKRMDLAAMPAIKQLPRLKQLWHAHHIEELLQQPQAWNLIDEIGRVSKENSLVNAYCALVIPAANGYAAFQRLEEHETAITSSSAPRQPEHFEVRAYPNPFNTQTRVIAWFQPAEHSGFVSVRIYSLLGAQVRQWQQPVSAGASRIELVWDGANDRQEPVSSGLYWIQVQRGTEQYVLKLTCLK